MSQFGNRLRQLRTKAKLTQSELGSKLGIAFSTVSMYERGEREPDFETMEAIADFFNVSMDYLHGNNHTNGSDYTSEKKQINTSPVSLTEHEIELILAYRSKPDMQASIDKLLDISSVQDKTIADDIIETINSASSAKSPINKK